MTSITLDPVGVVRSSLVDRKGAPRQPDEGAPPATIHFEAHVRDALHGLRAGDRIVVLTWLDRAVRDVQRVHPRGRTDRPALGVFNTRSPDRPNPIGVHEVEVTAGGHRRHASARRQGGAAGNVTVTSPAAPRSSRNVASTDRPPRRTTMR